jgi:hypothetical protein
VVNCITNAFIVSRCIPTVYFPPQEYNLWKEASKFIRTPVSRSVVDDNHIEVRVRNLPQGGKTGNRIIQPVPAENNDRNWRVRFDRRPVVEVL